MRGEQAAISTCMYPNLINYIVKRCWFRNLRTTRRSSSGGLAAGRIGTPGGVDAVFQKISVSLLAVAALSLTAPAASLASVAISTQHTTYEISNLDAPVTNIMMFQQFPGGASRTWFFDAPAGPSTITNPFPDYAPTTSTFMLGVSTDADTSLTPGAQHLVFFANDNFAGNAQGVAFDHLFPGGDEAALIADLTTGLGDPDTTVSDAAGTDLGGYADAAFSLVGLAPGDSFSVVSFSDGQIIGNGLVTTTSEPSAAPEPATWGLMMLGVAGMGAALRTRRRRSVAR